MDEEEKRFALCSPFEVTLTAGGGVRLVAERVSLELTEADDGLELADDEAAALEQRTLGRRRHLGHVLGRAQLERQPQSVQVEQRR